MIFNRGLIIGKFQPIHNGHLGLIRFGLNLCNSVDVHVSDARGTDIIPVYDRIAALNKDLGEGAADCFIVPFRDDLYEVMPRDKDGTVTDENYWRFYIAALEKTYENRIKPDVIISSDLYGKEIAKRFGVRWVPYDPLREMTSGLSATRVKEDLLNFYTHLSPEMRKRYGLTFALVGPESSGKTTLGKALAKNLRIPTTYVPEYGRTIDVFKGNLDATDFEVIGKAQDYLIDQARADRNYITVTDTEAMTTQAFSFLMLKKKTDSLTALFKKQLGYVSLYILLPPVIPFEDDGSRTTKDEKIRNAFFKYYEDTLRNNGAAVYIPTATDVLTRVVEIEKILETCVQTSIEKTTS